MTATVEITDGTTTIELTDNTNYGVLSWSPRMARKVAGGADTYEDVQEEMEIWIEGSSSTDFLDKVNDLIELLDQAVRWANGENVDAVTIDYTPASGGTEYKATIVSVPQDILSWPNIFALSAAATFKTEATLRFTRRGAWLGAEDTNSSSSINAGDVAPITMSAALGLSSPTKVFFQDIDTVSATEIIPNGYVVVCDSDLVEKYEAESVTLSGFSSASGSTNFASNDNVAQSSATPCTLDINITTDDINESARIGCFIVARVDSADTEWEMKFGINMARDEYIFARPVVFSDTTPAALHVGSVSNATFDAANARLSFTRLSGSGTISVDYIILVDVSSPSFGAVRLTTGDAFGAGPAEFEILIDHALLSRPVPRVESYQVSTEANRKPVVYRGSPIIYTKDAGISIVPLFVGGDSTARWRYGIDGSLEAFTAHATRRPAHLVPR